MKRFIFITRYFYPSDTGIARIVSDMAFDLATHQEVHVFTSNQGYEKTQENLLTKEKIANVNVTRISAIAFKRTNLIGRIINYVIFYFSCTLRLLKSIKQNDVVIVLSEPPFIGTLIAAITKLKRAKLINWIQDVHPEGAEQLGIRLATGWIGKMLRAFRNISWRAAITNIVLGNRMAKMVAAQGIQKERIAIYPNWEDGKLIAPLSSEKNTLRHAWGLEKKFVLGYSGNFGRAYDFKTIIDTAIYFANQKEMDDIVFLFIGDGYYKHFLETEAAKHQLNNVIFKPYQPREQLRESLNIPDVHLISTKPAMEGTLVPGKLSSAMAVGRPILFVGDHEGETAQILRLANCGETVSIGDTGSLANNILKLRHDLTMRNQLGQNARVFFEQQFDQAVALNKLSHFLMSV